MGSNRSKVIEKRFLDFSLQINPNFSTVCRGCGLHLGDITRDDVATLEVVKEKCKAFKNNGSRNKEVDCPMDY